MNHRWALAALFMCTMAVSGKTMAQAGPATDIGCLDGLKNGWWPIDVDLGYLPASTAAVSPGFNGYSDCMAYTWTRFLTNASISGGHKNLQIQYSINVTDDAAACNHTGLNWALYGRTSTNGGGTFGDWRFLKGGQMHGTLINGNCVYDPNICAPIGSGQAPVNIGIWTWSTSSYVSEYRLAVLASQHDHTATGSYCGEPQMSCNHDTYLYFTPQ